MKKTKYYKEYDVDITGLKSWEIELLEILKEITLVCGRVYEKQKNVDYPGANFYPHDIKREEINRAAKIDPDLLGHYTVVKRDKDGKLISVPYHEEYKNEVKRMSELLLKAASIHKDNLYKVYLRQLSKDLMSSDYSESEKLWLRLNGQNVDIRLGPIEVYNDKLLSVKRAFQSNLRVANAMEQGNVSDYITVINELQPSTPFSGKEPEVNLVVRVDNIVAASGWHADLKPRGSNYPEDADLYQYGAKVLIYANSLECINEQFFTLARSILSEDILEGLKKDRFIMNAMRYLLFHEIAEAIGKVRYPDYINRLVFMADRVRELYSDLVGVKSSSIQVLKGVLTSEDYRDILTVFVLEGVWQWARGSKKGRAVRTYAEGFALAMDFLIQGGSVCLNTEGKIEIDFPSMYSAIDTLSNIMGQVLREGSTKDAQSLFKKYSNTDFLDRFVKEVDKILVL